ncbi:MAG: flagellar biosynthetic protein FliO [Deltaproteobacteria bacterium]|nr:flagellar biosynthetic protein FliO [Deltaproteobacteria bacterium]
MTGSYAYLLVKAVVTLLFVLGLLVLALYALKRHMARPSGFNGGSSDPVKVITRFFLGQKKNLTVVNIAGEILVLGVTPNAITCLAKLESPEAVDEMKKFGTLRGKPFFNIF